MYNITIMHLHQKLYISILNNSKMLELKHNDYNIYMFVCVLLDVYLK